MPSRIEQQLTKLYNATIGLNNNGRRKYDPFEVAVTMKIKQRENTKYYKQLFVDTQSLIDTIQETTITEKIHYIPKELDHVFTITNTKINEIDDIINHTQAMFDTLQQNVETIVNNQNKNVLKNVFFEEIFAECERIERKIRERCKKNDRIMNHIELDIDSIIATAKEMIEYDCDNYIMYIFHKTEIASTNSAINNTCNGNILDNHNSRNNGINCCVNQSKNNSINKINFHDIFNSNSDKHVYNNGEFLCGISDDFDNVCYDLSISKFGFFIGARSTGNLALFLIQNSAENGKNVTIYGGNFNVLYEIIPFIHSMLE